MAQVKAAKGKDKDCPLPKYVTRKPKNREQTNDEPSLGTYGNGWSEEGRKRYCKLMQKVNESRAFYNGSFDVRMKKFAKSWALKEKNMRVKKPAVVFDMTNEFNLPSHDEIRQSETTATRAAADLLNIELMEQDDDIPI